jgi:hypothetical protein
MPIQIGTKPSSFSDPTGLMSDCHRRIEMFMRTLSVAAEFEGRSLCEEEGRALDAALRYFREAAPKHNADEEESLFPRLRSLTYPEVQSALAELPFPVDMMILLLIDGTDLPLDGHHQPAMEP